MDMSQHISDPPDPEIQASLGGILTKAIIFPGVPMVHLFFFFFLCYISITHVNLISVSDYHVTFLSTTLFWDAQQLATISSVPLFTWTFLQATLKSYLMSKLFGHHSRYQLGLFTLHFNPQLCVSGYGHAQNNLYYLSHVYSMSQKLPVVIFHVLVCLSQFWILTQLLQLVPRTSELQLHYSQISYSHSPKSVMISYLHVLSTLFLSYLVTT